MGIKVEQFVKKVDENLICSICQEVFQDPVNCRTGHTFCRCCIEEWLNTSRKCPMDNGFLEKCHLVSAYALIGIIDNLDVYCHPQDTVRGASQERFQEACGWTGRLGLFENHQKTCPFQQVPCGNCELIMQRKEMEKHDKICLYKKVECNACRQSMIRCELEKHRKDDCPEALIACPNACTSSQGQINKIKRVDVRDHVINICAKTKIDCPFKEEGCGAQFERQILGLHLRENMTGHMTMLAKQCSVLTKQNLSLSEQCSQLTELCTSLSEQCSSLTERCSLLSMENTTIKMNLEKQEAEMLSRSCYSWEIKDYPSQAKKYPNGSCFRSPYFWLCGYSWYLKIFPNGQTDYEAGWVSLYLCLGNEGSIPERRAEKRCVVPGSSVRVTYRMMVYAHDPGTENVSQSFDRVFDMDSDTWGDGTFMKATDAVSSRFCDAEYGSLTVVCVM